MKTVSSAEMRDIEAVAARDFGISELTLMENAGRAVADAAETVFESRAIPKDRKISVFCGTGNNGGDGLVAARYLHNRHYIAEIVLMKGPEVFKGVSLENYNTAERTGIGINVFGQETGFTVCGLIVDALLGTGFKGNLREPYAAAIELINSSGLPVVSVDIPSGMCADTGQVLDTAVKADVTVTMGIAKTGLAAANAGQYTGEILIADIGLPKSLI